MSGTGSRAPRRQPESAYADTDVFIALLVGPGHPLHESSVSIFRRVAEGDLVMVVTPVIVAELLSADGLAVAEAATIQRALFLYKERTKLDFADAYLAAAALEVGPPAVASFDRGLDTVEGVRRISV